MILLLDRSIVILENNAIRMICAGPFPQREHELRGNTCIEPTLLQECGSAHTSGCSRTNHRAELNRKSLSGRKGHTVVGSKDPSIRR